MKQLVTLLALAAIGFSAYKYHTDNVKSAEEARSNGKVRHAIGLSRYCEPLHRDLFSGLNTAYPLDLVPPLQITKERILDAKEHAEPEKQAVYVKGVSLLEGMIQLAEERTKALETVLKSQQSKGTLDGPTTASTSTAFFAQTALKRWEDEKKRQKPVIDQLFTHLRTAERDWNKIAGQGARVETYDFPRNTRVLITLDPAVTGANPLERGAYDQRQTWRTRYYEQFGFPAGQMPMAR